MPKIDTTLIEGYESMNAEEKLAALEAFEYDDYSSEVQRYKMLQQKQTERRHHGKRSTMSFFLRTNLQSSRMTKPWRP